MAVTSTPAIKGESINAGHKDQIDITDISQGNESCVNFSGGLPTPCKTTIGQVKFNMPLNTSAIGFRNQMFLGRIIDKVDVFFEKSGVDKPVTYQIIRMEGVYVVGVEEVADSDGRPTVQVILEATRIGWVYYKIDATTGQPVTPPVKTGWDVEMGKIWTPAN
jgi:type VI protein secretion system component Hcp